MSNPLWSDEQILSQMKLAARYNKDDYGAAYVSITLNACAVVAQAVRNDYEARIAALTHPQARVKTRL